MSGAPISTPSSDMPSPSPVIPTVQRAPHSETEKGRRDSRRGGRGHGRGGR